MITVRRALFLSTAEKYFSLTVNFLTLTVVSRILTPAEIGVSVIGAAIVAIAMSAREFASPNFIFQERDLKTETIRTVFTAMLLVTAAVSIVLAISAHWLAQAYGEQRLIPYLHVVAACIFLELFTNPIIAIWRREMAFVKVLVVNLAGAITTSVFSIGLALAGFSYMSIAWAWLAASIVTGSMAWLLSRRFDALIPRFQDLRAMLAFGGYNGATVALFRFYESMPYLILGRYVSVEASAMLNRSLTVCQLPDKVLLYGVVSVALPAFSAQARDGKKLKDSYLNATSLVTALHWPTCVMMAILAHPLVAIIFGPQWSAAAPLVQIIAMSLLFSFSFELNHPVLVAVGAMRSVFLRALIVFPIAAGIVTIASFYGAEAVAWSMMIVVPLHAYVSIQFVRRHILISWREVALSLKGSLAVTIAAAIGPLALIFVIGDGFDISIGWAAACVPLAAIGWITSLWATKHPLYLEIKKLIPTSRNLTVLGGKAAPTLWSQSSSNGNI